MASLPTRIQINEEGPREGFQFEKGDIPTARKIELIDSLSRTGIDHIRIVSFVNPKRVPGMADAEEVVAGFDKRPGIHYEALWLNQQGFERALALRDRLYVRGTVSLCASEPFLQRNQNRDFAQNIAAGHEAMQMYRQHGVDVKRASLMAVFGCNFAGDVPVAQVLSTVADAKAVAASGGFTLDRLTLADSMAWATPASVKRVVGAVQDAHPELALTLHLHDTRGMAIACAYAGMEMGVASYDASVGGLGGCPFAGHKGAAGNICTEDLVFMCDEMGIATGIDLEALAETGRLAEDIVGHPLPGAVMRGGSLRRLREKVREAQAA